MHSPKAQLDGNQCPLPAQSGRKAVSVMQEKVSACTKHNSTTEFSKGHGIAIPAAYIAPPSQPRTLISNRMVYGIGSPVTCGVAFQCAGFERAAAAQTAKK